MKSFVDCIPCFVSQALDCARMVTADAAVHERVVREVCRDASEMDASQPPPFMGQRIHRLIREVCANPDPYREVKENSNRLALELLPGLRKRIERAARPLELAVRLAVMGNMIDYAQAGGDRESKLGDAVEEAVLARLNGDVDKLEDRISSADRILYLTDNAGEIVMDRLLIERLPLEKVTVAVRGKPVLNDATMEDAARAGLPDIVDVIDNGSDVPGTILDDCSESFLDCFRRADLVIAKGQGNYESLSEVEKEIVFLLKAKCPVIADHLGCPVGSLVMRQIAGSVSLKG